MLLTIAVITLFQGWWIRQRFREERRSLNLVANISFRESIYSLQATKITLDSNRPGVKNLKIDARVSGPYRDMRTIVQVLQDKVRDSFQVNKTETNTVVLRREKDSSMDGGPFPENSRPHFFRETPDIVDVLIGVDSLQDSLKIAEVKSAFRQRLQEQGIKIPVKVTRDTLFQEQHRMPDPEDRMVTTGLIHPVTFAYTLDGEPAWLVKKILPQIGISLALVGVTILSFWLLYRNWMAQRKLAALKNEFISNITHELKTPIATVSVAIEALKGFDAIKDPERTKEYLDISTQELQRLSLLVDKVLKLSMFEKQEIRINEEPVALDQVVDEVLQSMRLQFERVHAHVEVQTQGDDFTIKGDRLHLLSVIYNLLDNALKYSNTKPAIQVNLKDCETAVELSVTDNGIGIAPEYKDKIFDKFFRVPIGDRHNVKGYGLGLSYLAYVVSLHHGTVAVESQPGIGSRFTIKLPK